MSFFKNMTLERVFIVLSLLGAVALTFTGVTLKGKHDSLREHLEGKNLESPKDSVPAVANELQRLSREYSNLYKARMGEGFTSQEGVVSYIRKCKDVAGAKIGQISITQNSKELDRRNALWDHMYTIKTQSSDTTLGRRKVVTFLRELELKSQQMRVTNLELRLSNKDKVEPHEIPPDMWLFNAICTSRQKKDA
jgi:hypothetical protein